MLDVYNERLADIVLTPTEGLQQQPFREHNNASHIPSVSRREMDEYAHAA